MVEDFSGRGARAAARLVGGLLPFRSHPMLWQTMLSHTILLPTAAFLLGIGCGYGVRELVSRRRRRRYFDRYSY